VGIFGHRFHGNTANFIQRDAADHRAGAAEEGGVPHVVPVLHQAIEQRAFVRRFRKRPRLRSNGSGEKNGAASASSPALSLSGTSPWSSAGTSASARGRSQRSNKLAFGILQRVVDVPGFRVFVGGAGDVLHADVFGELAELFAPAVIEDPDVELVFRPVDACDA
jgi:hypothetical protein